MENTLTRLPGGGQVKLFPSAIAVYNFASDDDGKLSRIISANPGMPIVFLSTKFNRNVFSQAEGHNRTFIFYAGTIDRSNVDPTYPADWISDGDFLPGVPGNLSIEATDGGFRIRTLPPDPARTAFFRG